MNTERIEHDFNHHAPDDDKVKRHQEVRLAMREAAYCVNGAVPDCREKSLAITKLEEALSWANAAIAREPRPPEAK